MKALVIGAGMMGSAAAFDLARAPGVEQVLLADIDDARALMVASTISKNVSACRVDVNSFGEVVALMKNVDVTIGATSYNHNLLLTKAAIEARTHFCDLGGNMDVVHKQVALNAQARDASVCILPNCGLAPGLACILGAGGAQAFQQVDAVQLRVGGLPKNPKPPLNYQIVFSVEGLINEYLEPAEVIRDGKVRQVESMMDLESLAFPAPFGKMEAFNTSGGVSTLPQMFEGKVQSLDYKTIRYPGHCEKFKTLLDLGFASSEPVMVGDSLRTAREIFEQLLKRKLPSDGPDVTLMRVTIEGKLDNKQQTLAYEMVDSYDERLHMTSMARTTAFPTSIIAQMIVDGRIPARGVMPPEACVPVAPLIQELAKRNVVIREELR